MSFGERREGNKGDSLFRVDPSVNISLATGVRYKCLLLLPLLVASLQAADIVIRKDLCAQSEPSGGLVPTPAIYDPELPLPAINVGDNVEFIINTCDAQDVQDVQIAFNGELKQASLTGIPGQYNSIFSIQNPGIFYFFIIVTGVNGATHITDQIFYGVPPYGDPPQVEIISPTNGGESPYSLGDTIAIDIAATDADGLVDVVEVFTNGQSLGWAAPTGDEGIFRLLYIANTIGSINLLASASDTSGNTSYSSIKTITVIAGSAPEPLAPVLSLDTFYESNSGESITIDATPTDGYPATYTYQWSFKAVGSSAYFVIPSNFGGTAANYLISGDSGNNGTWKVEVTNDTGTTEAEFEYRVYADSDSDGLSDGREEFVLGTDPNNNDSDSDTLLDGAETNTGIWVSTSDTGTDPLSSDTDGDGLLDGVETNTGEYIDASDTGTDPLVSDTDGDGLLDGAETNTRVYTNGFDTGTHPLFTDSDSDGLSDYAETNTGLWTGIDDTGTDPNRGDTDGDGIIDGRETNTGVYVSTTSTGTDPHEQDSDGDGFSDQFEVNTNYDPTSASDTPDALTVIRTAVEVDIYAADGGVYRVEHTEDLNSGEWVTVEDGIIGNGEIIHRLYSVREYSRRFFRVIRTDQ